MHHVYFLLLLNNLWKYFSQINSAVASLHFPKYYNFLSVYALPQSSC